MNTADFGDERLDARAVTLWSALGSRPNLSIPAACRGRAEMHAAYRFFDNDKVTFAKVLEPHIQRSRERVAQQPVVLLVQDTTEPPLEWLLLTTLPIDTPEEVRRVVEYYCVRWNVEVFFRTLKSGCRIERRRFEDVERVLPYLAIWPIVAWRTLFVCRLGRECPDLDCEAIFEPSNICRLNRLCTETPRNRWWLWQFVARRGRVRSRRRCGGVGGVAGTIFPNGLHS